MAARLGRTTALLAGIRAGGTTFIAFPGGVVTGTTPTQWPVDESGSGVGLQASTRSVHLPLRGQRWLGLRSACVMHGLRPPSFPLNCRPGTGLRAPTPGILGGRTYNRCTMSDTHTFAELADRIDRLLLRHEELQRTNELLSTEVDSLQAERDLLRSKLAAARARIVTLLERLTAASETGVDSSSSDPSSS